MPRAIILVLDSVGIGSAPDAAAYGDAGANTIGHIAEGCARGAGDVAGGRQGPLALPNLDAMGLGRACAMATGTCPPGLSANGRPRGRYGFGVERSKGKDTPSGHWEIAGVPVPFDWGYFPRTSPCFPPELVAELCRRAELPGILGDCHASGTAIIASLGEEHMRTGKPICYTSADSVFQIAAHEESFGLDRLYRVCEIAQPLTEALGIGRVIARPFVGSSRANFERTGNRRDYAVKPPLPTVLDIATAEGRNVISVGKIGDIFAHSGTGRVLKASGNAALFDRTLEGLAQLHDGGLMFTNFVDFDTVYGHRRDLPGYATALEAFDQRLPALTERLDDGDLLVITADHGCDPTWPGTDHTRELTPILLYGHSAAAGSLGRRDTFADIAAAVCLHLDLPRPNAGRAEGMLKPDRRP
ncbi:phosphopentomutase [Rhodoligotrophos defluvii]|uniref:phosphopentomutase n=1 Tax=Rhodoligotrophos defluvii TaxID=2561934 RepID=UPI0010CA0CFA|nr:phosphopentomutase [Rhodoligotrophos defluvii]